MTMLSFGGTMNAIYLFYPTATVVGILAHLAFSRRERTAEYVWGVILTYALFFNVGLTGLMGFFAHTFRATETAALIGWPAGSPFQFEVACANLAFGLLGVLCISLRGTFRLATIVGYSVFLVGAAFGHIQQMRTSNNFAPGNAGAPLFADIATPIVLLTIWVVHYVVKRKTEGFAKEPYEKICR